MNQIKGLNQTKGLCQIKRFFTPFKDLSPKCVDCKNFMKYTENNVDYDALGRCKKNGYFLPNSLETVYFYASSCRRDDKFCGKTGLYFENKK